MEDGLPKNTSLSLSLLLPLLISIISFEEDEVDVYSNFVDSNSCVLSYCLLLDEVEVDVDSNFVDSTDVLDEVDATLLLDEVLDEVDATLLLLLQLLNPVSLVAGMLQVFLVIAMMKRESVV